MAPIPSESNIIILQSYPLLVFPLIGRPHSQRPLVQALTVEPTSNPSFRSNNTLLSKNDLPVRYKPATPTIEIGAGIDRKKSMASGLIINCL